MTSVTRRISSYNHSAGNNIEYIVIHDTGNYKDTAAGNANYFNEGDRQSSAHYFIDNTSIWQVVEDYHAAWHCGDGHGRYGIGNHNSLGIELCNSGGYISEATLSNAVAFVKQKMNQYGVPLSKVVRHYDASRKDCPHNLSANNWQPWKEFKNRLAGASAGSTTSYTSPAEPDGTYGVVHANGGLNVRNSASMNASVIGSVSNGSRVRIGRKSGDWYNIYFGDHGGWVYAQYVTVENSGGSSASSSKPQASSAGKTATVTASVLNVRSGRGTGNPVIGTLKHGDTVKLCYLKDNWWSIDYGADVGYVCADYLAL